MVPTAGALLYRPRPVCNNGNVRTLAWLTTLRCHVRGFSLPDTTAQPKSAETPKAAAAFAAYVGMGPSRSLRKLADRLVAQKQYKTSATAAAILNAWSVKYGWQDRIANAATEQSTRMLEEAAELDADTFLATSKLLNETVHYSTRHDLDAVVKMRESVRKPMPKGGASVSVSVSVEVKHMAERMAKALGIDPEQLIADAERIAAEEWEKV